LKLIELYEKEPILYDPLNQNYRNMDMKRQKGNETAHILDRNGTEHGVLFNMIAKPGSGSGVRSYSEDEAFWAIFIHLISDFVHLLLHVAKNNWLLCLIHSYDPSALLLKFRYIE